MAYRQEVVMELRHHVSCSLKTGPGRFSDSLAVGCDTLLSRNSSAWYD